MKTLRLVSAPTHSRRLNEIAGLLLLVAAALLLLALASYTPTDPSFDTVGGYATGRPAHNWTGQIGAWVADAALQLMGVAAFLLPLALGRVGVNWMRSRPVGAAGTKWTGLVMWILFAPAAVALLPVHSLWRGALPLAGLVGRMVADLLVKLLNLPGATVVVTLAVVLSLYLATTFTFNSAREWATLRFSFVGALRERWNARQARRRGVLPEPEMLDEHGEEYGSRRAKADADARRERERAERAASKALHPKHTLLSGLFGWWNRRGEEAVSIVPHEDDSTPVQGSIFSNMPRTDVDAAPVTPLGTATAAAAPFAHALAAAAAPLPLQPDEMEYPDYAESATYGSRATFQPEAPAARSFDDEDEPFSFLTRHETPAAFVPEPEAEAVEARVHELVREISRAAEPADPEPARTAPVLEMPRPKPVAPPAPTPAPAPLHAAPADAISFGKRADADQKAAVITAKSVRGYKLPSSSLLYQSSEQAVVREDALRDEARVLVEKCGEFGVDGQVTQINPGPVVTTFEFRPDAGVKYSRVTGLADDLCLAMAAESILIERMPGKSTVGIQVPNGDRETIWLRDVVECESFAQSKSRLAIALGKDINGRIVTADLAGMPHVLIAGSTGSGKSVAINAMIMSVLFKSTPEQVRMILVDPKRVELGMYEGIPHLFTPIITEAKLAANALRNAVREMERRLKLLAANHVRNIDQFNKLFDSGSEYLFEDVNQEPLPYIIIIIDELADLMMLDRSNVEESITRLAQMARAVGIHLILATQRPSVDVITGLIKANVPTRMSFRLATKVDSRTIIDSNGAESLLGRGDMLYLPPGTSRLQRVHAPFVTEKEIAAVTEFWRAQGEAEYVEGFLDGPKEDKEQVEGSHSDEGEDDPMFDDAVRLVFEFGKASTSLLQRRLRIGYGRAAHLIDLMEKDGLVGPADGSKPREILKSPSFYKEVDAAMR